MYNIIIPYLICCKMIATKVQWSVTIPSSRRFFVCDQNFKDLLSQQLSDMQYSVITLYILSLRLICFMTESLCLLTTFSQCPFPLSLVTTRLIAFSMNLFQIPHISEIMQYLSYSVWLTLHSIMFSRPIYVSTNGRISLVFMDDIYTHTHTHAHTHIYIYIKKERDLTIFLFIHLLMESQVASILGCQE